LSKRPNYYRILGISPLANETEIKSAYRMLAKRYHPDTMPPERREWARNQMARINAAYQVLQDPQRRARYDLERGYAWAQRPAAQFAVKGTAAASNSAIWHRQRARERLRRQRAKRWQLIAILCGAALIAGILITLLFVRMRHGYVISAVLNAGILSLLLVSLAMANR
jgi:curved DNA-binding protein CbpA